MPVRLIGRLFVATLGFNDTFITSTMIEYAARRGDGLLVVTLKPVVKGVQRALENLTLLARRMGVKVHPHLEVDPLQAVESIGRIHDEIAKTVDEWGYTMIVADLTGGPRIVVVATLLALLLVSESVRVDVRVQNEAGDEGELRVPLGIVRLMLGGLGVRGRILQLLAETPGLTTSEIAGRLGVAEKTVANYISQLSRQGLVAKRGRKAGVYLTEWGRLLARLGGQ